MRIHFNVILRILIFLIGITVTFTVINSSNTLPNSYYLVPLIYSVLIIIFPSITRYMFKNIGLLALNISMIIRYLLSPLLISFNGIEMIRGIYPIESSYNIGVNLILYELILVFIIFQLFYKKFYVTNNVRQANIYWRKNILGWVFILICLGIIMIYPELLGRYSFILTTSELKSKSLEIDIISFLPLLVQLGTLILTLTIINIIYKYYSSSERFIFVLLSILTVFIISSFIIGTSRFSVVLPLVTSLYVIYIVFSKYKKQIAIISICIVLFTVLSTSILKASTISSEEATITDFLVELNSNLQLYFSGVSNVAIAVQTSNIYTSYNYESIISDTLRSVVLVNSFFKSSSSALVDFNVVFYNGGLARDQILPMIGQGYLYFGFFLSPLFSIMTLILLMYFDSKTIKTSSIMYKYIYAYISLKFGLFMMTNITNLLSFLTNYFLILFIIFYINDKLTKYNYEVLYENRQK